MDGEELATGARASGFVDPFEDTAPQPVVHPHAAHPHHHEGTPGPAVSPPGHHAAEPTPPVAGRHTDHRRRTTLLVTAAGAAALALVAGVGWALAGRGPSTAAEPAASGTTSGAAVGATPGSSSSDAGTGAAAPTPAMLPASQPTLVLGDSLGLVVYPYLADLLPDRYVSYESQVGRSTAGTARALARLSSVPPVVIVSTGTNDGTAADLTANGTTILDALGTQRCVVWVDVVRPDRVGDSQQVMNAALDNLVAGRSNVRIVHWSAMIAAHPEWLAGDGIHPTEEGAKARAQAYADAAASCSPIDPTAPRAKRQYLPDSVFWGPISGSGHSSSSSPSGTSPSRSSSPSKSASPSPSRTSTAPSPTKPSDPTPTPTPTATAATTSTTPTADTGQPPA